MPSRLMAASGWLGAANKQKVYRDTPPPVSVNKSPMHERGKNKEWHTPTSAATARAATSASRTRVLTAMDVFLLNDLCSHSAAPHVHRCRLGHVFWNIFEAQGLPSAQDRDPEVYPRSEVHAPPPLCSTAGYVEARAPFKSSAGALVTSVAVFNTRAVHESALEV
jgi:hypothetical protein